MVGFTIDVMSRKSKLLKKKLQIDSKRSEMRKKHETANTLPAAVSTNFISRKC